MKKYSKPEITFEDFSVSTNIAADCDMKHGPAQDICGFVLPGAVPVMLFALDVPGTNCTANGNGEEDKYNGFCYHVPDGGLNLFAS